MSACIPIDIEDLPTGSDAASQSPAVSPTEIEETPTYGEATPTGEVTGSNTQTPSGIETSTQGITPSPTATPSPTPTPTLPLNPTPTPTAPLNPTVTPTAPLNPTATPTAPLYPTPTLTPTPTNGGTPSNDEDGDGSLKGEDCDDNDPNKYPGAQESCNEEDDDCDEAIDEGAGVRTYPDVDGDGYGDETQGRLECEVSEGFIRAGSDCDDNDPWRNPGAPFEYQDTIDNDCDLEIDEVQLASSSMWTTSGTEGNSWTGSSLIGIGDFDQDGYDDMAVGDSWGDGNRGRATIFYGQPEGAEPSSSDPESWILTGDQELGQAGLALASGDFNADGIPDLAVGQPLANRVSLIFGDGIRRTDQTFLEDAGTTVNAPRGGILLFGNALAAADMDGDGDDDLIIGSPGYEVTGRVFILFGREGLEDGTAFNVEAEGRILDDLVGGSTQGYTAVKAGDLNNDGKEDVLVGSMLASATLQGESCDACGVIAILYGDDNTSQIGTNSRTGLLVGQFEGSGLGWGVGSAGNVNGDDYDDIIVGAPSYRDNDVEVGRAYVILGQSGRYGNTAEIRERAHIIIDGIGANAAELGNLYSVGSPGDVNGDGFDDIWVGGVSGRFTGDDPVGVGALFMGEAFEPPDSPIYHNITEGDVLFQGAIANGNFGSVGTIGDLNQDGYDDLLMGAYTAKVNNESRGQAYLFWGYPGSN